MPLDSEASEIVSSDDILVRSRAREGQASETYDVVSTDTGRVLGDRGETRGIGKKDLYQVRQELLRQEDIAFKAAKERLIEIREQLQKTLDTTPEEQREQREQLQSQIQYINNKARDNWSDFSLAGVHLTVMAPFAGEEALTNYVSIETSLKGQVATARTAQGLISKPLEDPEFNLGEEDLRLLSRAVASSSVDQLIGTNSLSKEKFGIDPDGNPLGISVQVDGMGVMGSLPNGKPYYMDVDYSSPDIQKGLYDLEALDFITGQIDRHAGNIFIDPETGEVRGIDNDLAFPEMSREEMLDGEYRPKHPVGNLPRYMHEDTARKIESLKPDDLRKTLSQVGYPPKGEKGKLKPEEIEGAVQRLEQLQSHIQTLRSEGHVVSKFTKETYEEAVKHQEDATSLELGEEATLDDVAPELLSNVKKTSYVGTVAIEKRVNAKYVELDRGETLDVETLKERLDTTGKAERDPLLEELARLEKLRVDEQTEELLEHRKPELDELNDQLKSVEEALDELDDPGEELVLEEGERVLTQQELRKQRIGILQEIRGVETRAKQVSDAIVDEEKPEMMMQAQQNLNQALGRGDPSVRHYQSFDSFRGKPVVGAGGATGSGRVKVDGQYFQLKSSIEHSSWKRRFKSDGLNHENYGEVIASNVSKALVGAENRRLIPEVTLRQDSETHEPKVTSKYLAGGQGDLDDLYRAEMGKIDPSLSLQKRDENGKLPIINEKGKKVKHARITLEENGKTGPGVLKLDGQAAQDVRRNIALSALMGDHDVNPGNMIAVEGGRVGRIDFGHAFNELITGMGGTTTGGGGPQFEKNRILDFFNREHVSGARLGGDPSKLWRDYEGIGPSREMTEALREVAASTEAMDGLMQAKAQFSDLIADLQAENTPEARAEIEDLTESLARISENIGKPITSTEPNAIVTEVFKNLGGFLSEGQKQMNEVADLCSLQTRIDTFLRDPANEGQPLPQEITTLYNLLAETENSSVKAAQGEGLQWMKNSKDTPAMSGNLESYVKARQQVVRLERNEGKALNEIDKLEARKAKLENSPSLGERFMARLKHPTKGIQGEIDKIDGQVAVLKAAVKEIQEGVSVDDDRELLKILKETDRALKEDIDKFRMDTQAEIYNGQLKIGPEVSDERIEQAQRQLDAMNREHEILAAKIEQEKRIISVREKMGLKENAPSSVEVRQQQDVEVQDVEDLEFEIDDLQEELDPIEVGQDLPRPELQRSKSVRDSLGVGSKGPKPGVEGPKTEVEPPKRKMTI